MEISEIKKIIDEGNYSQALEAIDRLKGEERLEGSILKSLILERKGDLKKALVTAKGVLEECRVKGSPNQVLRAILMLGNVHYALHNITELTDILQDAEEIFSEIKTRIQVDIQESHGYLLFLQGCLSEVSGSVDQALELLEHSLVVRQALPYQHDIVETLTKIGFMHVEITGKHSLALDLFNRSLAISEKLENQTALAHSLNRLGCHYIYIGNHDKALPLLEKSLALYQQVNNKFWIAGLYNNISLIYRVRENYDLTLNYLERSLAISEDLGDVRGTIINHTNIGRLYCFKGDFTSAEQHFTQSLKINEELGNSLGQAWVFVALGDLNSIWKGDLGVGLDYYQRSLSILKEKGSELGIAWTLLRFAMTYILQGEPELALKNIKESEDINIKLDNKIGIGQCSVQLGRIYKLQGKYDKAIQSLEGGLKIIKETVVGANMGLWVSYVLFYLIL
ncbi:MAG: tetratricopeptide repeat protein, partial [Candidatus Hodarchaeales archaeon]